MPREWNSLRRPSKLVDRAAQQKLSGTVCAAGKAIDFLPLDEISPPRGRHLRLGR